MGSFADWLQVWDAQKIPNAEKFSFSAQTSNALQRTARCHAALIEDLLDDGYDFVLTAKFQSDPLERRYSQYRQMSGGRFLVSLKDISTSEKILKMKSILKEDLGIEDGIREQENQDDEVTIL